MKRAILLIAVASFGVTAAAAKKPVNKGSSSEASTKVKKSSKVRIDIGIGSRTALAPAPQPVSEMPSFKSAPESPAPSISNAATIMAYKRDPVPIYDDTGSKLADVPKAKLPKANSPAARVVGTKPGFVAITMDGQRAWLRLTAVDYVGTVAAPTCAKVITSLAKLEEDGVERSLGLGCNKKN
jgi:hypothetical protein